MNLKSNHFAVFKSILTLTLMITAGGSMAGPVLADSAIAQDAVMVDFESINQQLLNLEPDPEQVADVEQFEFRRDAGHFTLKKGKLYLCKPVRNRVCAAFFDGEGEFSFTPPTRVEKEQLERFFDTQTLTEKFNALFLLFADTTLEELQRHFTFTKQKAPRDVANHLSYALKYLTQADGKEFDPSFLKTCLDNLQNGFFHAHFSDKKIEPLFFEINPFAGEEVRFMRRLKGPSYLYLPEIINQFHLQKDYASGIDLTEEDKNNLHILNYKIECTLEGSGLDFSAAAEFNFTALKPSQNWLDFFMFGELEVDSVFWEDGSKADYVKKKDHLIFWVKGDHPIRQGENRTLKVYYHGKLIERIKDWFYIRSSRAWYPRHGLKQRSNFDIVYHIPRDFQFASVGDCISSETNEDGTTSRWVTTEPIQNASFNIGFFKDYKIDNDTIPPTTIYMSETGHQEIARQLARQGIGSGKNMEKQVGKDIKNSLHFFQDIFGKPKADRFFATEIPYTHGESFPGLIYLSWKTFQMTRASGDDEIFRAHETAHQWWGIGVDFQTYHDQWLSEGFSEYCGWWYYHEVVKREEEDEKKFYKMLEDRRKEITGNRKFFWGKGRKAGPIWLGYRTLSSDTEEDYRLIIYKKGAWILHMLRSMLLDPATLDDSAFKTLLEGFYRQYAGDRVTTEEFRSFAEKSIGQDLEWFFGQWVYGMDIPMYKYAYKITETEDGQYRLNCRVKQEDVSPDFRMPILVGIDFGDDDITARRILVSGPVTETELGKFSKKPEGIIFNYLESVLCEIKDEAW